MELSLNNKDLLVYKALASEARLTLLENLLERPKTVSELAKALNLSKAIASRHLSDLENAGLISHQSGSEIGDNRKKLYFAVVDHIEIEFPKKLFLPYEKNTQEIKLGYFSDFSVEPTCGLADGESLIGELDDPRTFALNQRINASLLWFTSGYVEYIIPNSLSQNAIPELLEISLELSSEFPVSNNNWPSDISFYINEVNVGTWTAPGNFSDVRGKLTPDWWDNRYSQYGLLKFLRINHEDTGIDGQKISDIHLEDLNLQNNHFIKFRIGIDEKAQNKGGVTIFGADFGNHPQNILSTLYYTER